MNLWGHQKLAIIAYFSLNIGKLITENLYISFLCNKVGGAIIKGPYKVAGDEWLDIPWWISPKSLRKWVVSLSSNASINHPPHPALFYQNMTLKSFPGPPLLIFVTQVTYYPERVKSVNGICEQFYIKEPWQFQIWSYRFSEMHCISQGDCLSRPKCQCPHSRVIYPD